MRDSLEKYIINLINNFLNFITQWLKIKKIKTQKVSKYREVSS